MHRILKLLEGAYGPRRRRRSRPAIDQLVATILSQNTNDANSSAGFEALKDRFRSWRRAADAPVSEIARCIRASGLARRKAPRIKAILRRIRAETGALSLEFLSRLPAAEAFEYLTAFDGVGPKTALCVLLFSFGMPVFPVDTHIYRIACRLGLLDGRTPPARAHEALTDLIAPADRYAMHVLLIAHGRATCLARGPRCRECCLIGQCSYGRGRAKAGPARR